MDGGSPTMRKKRGDRQRRGTREGSLESPSPYLRGMMTPDGQPIGPDGKVSSKGSSKNKKPGSKHSGKGGKGAAAQVVVSG